MENTRPSSMPYGLPLERTAVEKQSPGSVGVTSDCGQHVSDTRA